MDKDFLSGDMFESVEFLMSKAPIGTKVSAGFRLNRSSFKKEPKPEDFVIIDSFQIDPKFSAKVDVMVMEDEQEWEKRAVRREVSRYSMRSASSKKSKASKKRKASSRGSKARRSKASSRRSKSSRRSDRSVATEDLRTMASDSAYSMKSLRDSLANCRDSSSFVDSNPLIDNRSEITSLSARTSFLFPECRRMSAPERTASGISLTSTASTGPLLSARIEENNQKIRASMNQLSQALEEKRRRRRERKAREAARVQAHHPVVGLNQAANILMNQLNLTNNNNLQLRADVSHSTSDITGDAIRSLRF